jgi:hypothetical protein
MPPPDCTTAQVGPPFFSYGSRPESGGRLYASSGPFRLTTASRSAQYATMPIVYIANISQQCSNSEYRNHVRNAQV